MEESPRRSHWPITAFSTFGSLSNIAMALLLARILPPAELGVFKVFFLYISICPALFLVCGVNHGFSCWSGRAGPGLKCIQMSSFLILGNGLVALALAFALGRGLTHAFHWQSGFTLPFAVSVFAVVAANFFEDAVIASGRIWRGAIFTGAAELARTGAMIAAAVLTGKLQLVLEAHAAVQTLRVVLGYAYGYRIGLSRWGWDWAAFKEISRYALPVSLAFILGIALNYSDQILLSRWISPAEFAFYSIGCLTVPPLTILQAAMVSVLVPQLSLAFESGESRRAAELHRRFMAEVAYFMIPAVAGLIVFASPIIELLFTSRYASAAIYLRYYAFWYLSLVVAPDVVPRARGEGKWIFGFTAVFAAVTVLLCWSMTRWEAALGALGGLLLARAAARAYGLWYAGRSSGWRWREFIPMGFSLRLMALAMALGLGCLWSERWLGSGSRWLFIAGSAFTASYFILSWRWRRETLGAASPAKRKVLLLSQHMGIGGLERMLLGLALTLRSGGSWEPDVLVFDHLDDGPGSLAEEFVERSIPIATFLKPRGFSPRTVFRIVRYALTRRIRVIHSHDLGALVYAVCARFSTLGYLRVVHTQHSFVHLKRHRRYRLYERFFTRFADRLTVVSESTREIYLSLGVSSSRIQVIRNGVRFSPKSSSGKLAARAELAQTYPALARSAPDSIWLLYLARIHRGKGQDHALEIWARLPDRVRSQSLLLFVGPETDPDFGGELERLISRAPAASRIVKPGPTLRPESWLEASDVFLSCSEFEGMPLGPIEAVGSGLPLFLSRIPGHSELRDFSFQFRLDDPGEAAAGLTRMLDETRSRAQSAELGDAAELARNRFSIETMTRRYEEIYACQLS